MSESTNTVVAENIKKGEEVEKNEVEALVAKLKAQNAKLNAELSQLKASKDKPEISILTKIQTELKVPKTQYNKYGNFNYRRAEDIEQALKPLLRKYGAQLYFDEKMIEVGGRVYVEEVAHYKDTEQEIIITGHAREAMNQKGMSDSQITGSASSYATKYALAKLFLIDDTEDADSYNNQSQEYSAMFNDKLMPLSEIWQAANKNDESAAAWWNSKYKEDGDLGDAVREFTARHKK